MKYQKFIVLSVIPVLFFLAPKLSQAKEIDNFLFAQNNATGQARATERCNAINSKVDNVLRNYQDKKTIHLRSFDLIKDRLNRTIKRLESIGADTTKVKEDMTVLDGYIKEFVDKYDSFIAKLNEAKELECGNSQGEFKAKMQESRVLLRNAKEAAVRVRAYVSSTLLADIRKSLEDFKSN